MFTNNSLLLSTFILLGLARLAQVAHGFKAMAYYFEPESQPSLQAEVTRLDEVMFDMYGISNKGDVYGSIPPAALNTISPHRGTVKVFMTASNYGPDDFNTRRIHAVLRSATYRNKLIKNLVNIAVSKEYDGVNIDFEAIPKGDRSRYTQFIKALSANLKTNGKLLAISVPGVTEDNPNDSWAGAYDLATLGQYVDILQLMTYDENGPWGAPGPVAGLDWVTDCVTYVKSVVDPSKISMGVPAYGYVWNLDKNTGRTVAWVDIPDLIAGKTVHWDAASSSPWIRWTENGVHYEAWFENTQSIQAKQQLARNNLLHGISVWALGLEDSSFWDAMLT
jgi:spore germination protein